MASIPGFSADRRARPSDTAASRNCELARAPGHDSTGSFSAGSLEDSETVLLNRESPSDRQPPTEISAGVSNKSPNSVSNTSDTIDSSDTEPRKCWICYTDETEDSPLNSEWRSPCPCALTAHEACLLDWLADMENPRTRNLNGRTTKMLCPQCKSEIMVARPRNFVVDAVRMFERLAGRLVLPGVVFTLAGTVWAGCCAHGMYSMYFVFGKEEARRIFEENVDGPWPFIPLALIFARTRYAEALLPTVPVLFFASHGSTHESDLDLWPPSAAMTFAALPYVKSFYTTLYERFFGTLERKWVAEIQPRAGENEAGQQDAVRAMDERGNDEQILMEIDLELQVGLGGDEDAQEAPAGQNQGAGPMPGVGRAHNELITDGSSLAGTVLGALLFPAISASMGGLLKLILPKSWTTPSSMVLERGRAGLFQTRWGRSVVGGCVFVLLKDALILYCRWKLAQTHRKRRILNYDRKKKQVAGKGNDK